MFKLLLPLLLLSGFASGQKGFHMIRKAEKCIERGRYQKATRLLDKAERADYGFCSIAHLEARSAIIEARISMADTTKDYVGIANALNALDFYQGLDVDSLKMIYYVKHFGKERIRCEIDSCLNLITSFPFNEFTLKTSFSEAPFTLSFATLRKVYDEFSRQADSQLSRRELFQAALRKQAFYQVLED